MQEFTQNKYLLDIYIIYVCLYVYAIYIYVYIYLCCYCFSFTYVYVKYGMIWICCWLVREISHLINSESLKSVSHRQEAWKRASSPGIPQAEFPRTETLANAYKYKIHK